MTQDPLGDIPLFREIQKILSSSEGPINLEIARQVANALNQDSTDHIDPDSAQRFAQTVATAGFVVAGYTRLTPDEPARAELVSRRDWVARTLTAWQWLLTHLAARFASEIGSFSEERGAEVDPMGAVMGQVAPLLMGMQAGTLVGQVAHDATGRYDPPIPREDDGHLFQVAANVEAIAEGYSVPPDHLSAWLAVGDVVRHSVSEAIPWVSRYRRSLFIEVVDSLEIDPSDLERRLEELQTRGPEALQEGLGPTQMIPVVPTERHQAALRRLHAFTSVFDGYARHVLGRVSEELIGNIGQIEEAMRRRDATPGEGTAMLNSLLGISFDPALAQSGTTFAAAVVELKGINQLNRVWDAPDNLPSIDEIRDPFAWMERVLVDE
ncbi:MAG TPA: zinc-dependent metalloprotease [Actinomycetota bacterium]|nr:zinc-dependent metalloprotease [Actinomycetota bacterium]